MELPLLHLVLHEPDVALTDLALCIETCIFGCFFLRNSRKHTRSILVATLFFFLSSSSLFGALYHGFFPLRTETQAGWILWLATMLTIGGATTMVWILLGELTRTSLRWIVPSAFFLFGGYLIFLLCIDSRFWVSALFSIPPLLLLLAVFCSHFFRHRSAGAAFGICAILLMFFSSALQQSHIGLHPIYCNFNALYHLIQGVALALLFHALRLYQYR